MVCSRGRISYPSRMTGRKWRAHKVSKLEGAIEALLENRKKATGDQACAPSEILTGLEAGGFDFRAQGWKDNDRLRSLSITLGKNPKFHRLPNGTYGLISWYPSVAAKKERPGKNGATETDDAKE